MAEAMFKFFTPLTVSFLTRARPKTPLFFAPLYAPVLLSMRRKSRHVCAVLPLMPFISATRRLKLYERRSDEDDCQIRYILCFGIC